jgi:hypothetical protein
MGAAAGTDDLRYLVEDPVPVTSELTPADSYRRPAVRCRHSIPSSVVVVGLSNLPEAPAVALDDGLTDGSAASTTPRMPSYQAA